MKTLYTIEDISRKTGLELSQLRYYESEYPDDLPPKVLRGDTLFFDESATEAFMRIHSIQFGNRVEPTAAAVTISHARVIAVTSGKGGVGKTNICLNLAIELQRLGKLCLVLDADMGMANIHLLAGIEPGKTISDILSGGRNIADIVVQGPEGIGIIPGGGGMLSLADGTRQDRLNIVRALKEIERHADIILVDTGAGMASSVRDFLLSADEVLFVLTPEITSLADAYGLLKALHREKIGDIPIYSVVNMVHTVSQAMDVAGRFGACADKFLGRPVDNIGYILKDATVSAAAARRTPFCVFKPLARVSRNVHNIAAALLDRDLPGVRAGSAFARYLETMRTERNGKAGAGA